MVVIRSMQSWVEIKKTSVLSTSVKKNKTKQKTARNRDKRGVLLVAMPPLVHGCCPCPEPPLWDAPWGERVALRNFSARGPRSCQCRATSSQIRLQETRPPTVTGSVRFVQPQSFFSLSLSAAADTASEGLELLR